MSTPDAKEHWEQHYGERDRVWSGRVNVRLAESSPATANRSSARPRLRRGSGLGVAGGARLATSSRSTSRTPRCGVRRRPRRAACSTGSTSSSTTLSETFPEGEFDLVSAHFLHSTLPLDRNRIFMRAADALKPGGTLLIVDHSAPPPGDSKLHHHHCFRVRRRSSPRWVCRTRNGSRDESGRARGDLARQGTLHLVDNVIVLRRRTSG